MPIQELEKFIASYNSFFGWNAGGLNTTGRLNSFFGSGAGSSNTTGTQRVID